MKTIKLCMIVLTLYIFALCTMDFIFIHLLNQNIFFPYLSTKLLAFSMPVAVYFVLRINKIQNILIPIVLMTLMVIPLIVASYVFYLKIGGVY